jgi:RNA polymerase sigma-70 factor (ECF subfamily)
VGNPEDAKDVLQEAFIKVYTNIGSFKEEARFATWFYRIVVNCSLDFLRKKKTMRRLLTGPVMDEEGKEMEFPDPAPGTREHAACRDLEERLDTCLRLLPERQRACFILKHRNGLNNAQIARVLRCGVPTVKVHLFRAASALRVRMAGYLKEEAGNA